MHKRVQVTAAAALFAAIGLGLAAAGRREPAEKAPTTPTTPSAPEKVEAQALTSGPGPEAWGGHWKGPMAVSSRGAASPDGLRMELRVGQREEAGRREWTIIYDGPVPGMRQERKYTLVDVDSAKGLYAIDENNSIVLRATFLDGTLSCPFEVGGSMYWTSYRMLDAGGPSERLEVTLTGVALDKPATTGGEKGTPSVRTWEVTSVQRAELRRK